MTAHVVTAEPIIKLAGPPPDGIIGYRFVCSCGRRGNGRHRSEANAVERGGDHVWAAVRSLWAARRREAALRGATWPDWADLSDSTKEAIYREVQQGPMAEVELGWSRRSAAHVILHPQPPRPAGKPDYWMATACGQGLAGLNGNLWLEPHKALGAIACARCRRYLTSLEHYAP